ncbi:glycosyltransferase family 4 protein [Svornostia abyssi]|uniref:Glycosyltransferase family 4 protein n=1 Tax=Svornostia abyssi TaxID=2898438 RepID=A0ABY5PLS9_9ACTN|nr:glycosyltransferase family 4 protein [Parviterribacteraceae bacterium J379]
MPHAALLSPFPDGRSGGIERFCQQLAGVLRAGGWRADIVGPGAEPNVWVDRLGGGAFARSRAAVAAAVELQPDLVIGNNWLGWGAPRGVPHIQVYHCTLIGLTRAAGGGLTPQDRLRRLTFQAACEALGGRDARTVAVSQGVADELRRYYRQRDPLVIGHGVDTATFAPGDREAARAALGVDGPTALFVGRAEWGKGADVAVQGARDAGYAVLHAGLGDLPGARELGALDPDDLARAYRAADCLLLPTRYEAFGLAFAEAAACGTPIVAPRVGWMTDLVAGVPGYEALTIEPTVGSVTAGLRRLAALDAAPLVAAAREFTVATADLDGFAARWLGLCNEAVAARLALLRG